MSFKFKNQEIDAEWVDFQAKLAPAYERIKTVLREPPTSDVPAMCHKLEFYAGWLPYMAEMRAKAERFYKIAKVQALQECPYQSPEYKVRVWVEGEIADVEYFFNHLHAVYSAGTDSGIKLQTALRVEMDLLNINTHRGGSNESQR